MLTDDKNYEIYILKQAINHYLDRTLSVNDEDALNTLLYQCDDLVWKIATEIYSQSGHTVEFSLVRDLATSRIEALKIAVEKQKAKQARLREIEEARRVEAEARLKAIEEARRAKAEQLKAIEEARRAKEKDRFLESGGDINMFELFLRMKKIIIKQSQIDPNYIDLNSNILKDIAKTELDAMELIMVIEKELALKIPSEISYPSIGRYCDITFQELLAFIYEQSLLKNKSR